MFNVALRSATIAAERASLGSVLSIRPVSINRTRADSFGGTSTTCSPAPTSCWANIAPIPVAPSIAQRPRLERGGPLQQTGPLMTVSDDPNLADHHLVGVDRGGGVGPLVRVDPDHEHGVLQTQCGRGEHRGGQT